MRADKPLNDLHNALAHAAYEGFSIHEYEDRDWEAYSKGDKDKTVKKTRKHRDYDIEVYNMFPQTWGSTALGFGGIGGASMTTAYTIILYSQLNGEYCVYFGGSFAYRIDKPDNQFFEDISRGYMESVSEIGRAHV